MRALIVLAVLVVAISILAVVVTRDRERSSHTTVAGSLAAGGELLAAEHSGQPAGRSTPAVPPHRSAPPGGGRSAAEAVARGLRVRVVSALDGGPVEGAEVHAEEWSDDEDAEEPLAVVSLLTDERGEVQLPTPALVDVQVFRPGFVTSKPRSSEGDRELLFRLWPVASVEFLVVDSRTGAPLEMVRLGALQNTGETWTVRLGFTDAAGVLRLERFADGLPARTRIQKEGYVERVLEDVVPRTLPRLRVELEPFGWVEGTVSWADGSPVQGAAVELVAEWRGRGQGPTRDTTDSDGRYRIGGVPKDAWCRVRVRSRASAVEFSGEPFRTREAGESIQHSLVLQAKLGALELRVEDDTGRPLSGARAALVRLWPSRGAAIRSGSPLRTEGMADDAGTVRFPKLLASRYRVGVTAEDETSWSGEVEVAAGRTLVIPIRIERGNPLRVRILSAEGEVLPGVDVVFFQAGASEAESRWAFGESDADGRVELLGLRAEPGVLSVDADSDLEALGHGLQFAWEGIRPGPELQDCWLPAPSVVRGRFSSPRSEDGLTVAFLEWSREGGRFESIATEVIPAEDGAFEIRFIGPRSPFDLVIDGGFQMSWDTVVFRDLALAPGETLDLGEVDGLVGDPASGRLLDAEGAPLAGGSVRIVGPGTFRPQVVADEDGSFQFEAVPPGRVLVYAEAEGRRRVRLDLESSAELDGRVITLEPLGRVLGRVRSRSGELRGRPIVLFESDEEDFHTGAVKVDKDGTFEFAAAGVRYRVWYSAFGDVALTRGPDLVLEPGETRELELELP